MISSDEKSKLNLFLDDFIEKALRNNYEVLDESLTNNLKASKVVDLNKHSLDEIMDYCYTIIKSDTRIHFYGVGEVYYHKGNFRAVENNPVITNKIFDNPFDAIDEDR